VGRRLGPTPWLTVGQERIDAFAAATGDLRGVHNQPVAQCFLGLALSNYFLPQLVEVHGISMGVNYGTGRVRFPAPLPPGARARAAAEIVSVSDVPGGVQATIRITVEREGSPEPACMVEALARYLR
jgi:acyl dehydratase